jgi:hypothetical protein
VKFKILLKGAVMNFIKALFLGSLCLFCGPLAADAVGDDKAVERNLDTKRTQENIDAAKLEQKRVEEQLYQNRLDDQRAADRRAEQRRLDNRKR